MKKLFSLDEVRSAVESFKSSMVPEKMRDQIQLTPQYELFDGPHGKRHWPRTYGEIWGNSGNTGVYLHFDANDSLLYVGKAVSIENRLGAYFKGKHECRIRDESLKDSVRVRAVILDGETLKFFTPSLEWYLIDQLDPPVNKQHKKKKWMTVESEQ
jgi:hypothetical protein